MHGHTDQWLVVVVWVVAVEWVQQVWQGHHQVQWELGHVYSLLQISFIHTCINIKVHPHQDLHHHLSAVIHPPRLAARVLVVEMVQRPVGYVVI